MSNIEKLYYNMSRLSDSYSDSEEVKTALSEVENVLGYDSFMEYEEIISAYAAASEKQGFIAGFQYAVSLLTNRSEGMIGQCC